MNISQAAVRLLLLHALCALALALPATAVTHFVAVDTTNPVPPYLTWDTAATSIQAAVDVSIAGDTVLVSNGVYATGGRAVHGPMTNRVALTNAFLLQSVNGPAFTTIRGAGSVGSSPVRCVYAGSNATLSGFTLTGGATMLDYYDPKLASGGGAHCEPGATIRNCMIVSNAAQISAGGAYQGSLVDCTLSGNTAVWAGGGTAFSALQNCLVSRNSAGDGGGARGGVLNNCLLTGNSGYYGGGSYGAILNNCTLSGNFATQVGGGSHQDVLNNCIVYYNTAGSSSPNHTGSTMNYCCATPLPAGTGNIGSEPRFVASNDFHLATGSPCINAGNNIHATNSATDLDGLPRIVGGTVDLGPAEFLAVSGRVLYVGGDLAFGPVVTGATASITMFIGNHGDTPLTVTSIDFPPGFTGAWAGVLGPVEVVTVPVAFAPTALQTYGGTVTVNADSTAGSNTIMCSGSGVAADRVVALSGNLAFGTVNTGQTRTANMIIANSGSTPLSIAGVGYPPGFGGAWSGTVQAGHASTVTVTFAPSAVQTYGGTIAVNSDATGGSTTIVCSGTGAAVQRQIGVRGTLAMGVVVIGRTASASLTITNTGNDALTVTSISYPIGFSGAWSGLVSAGQASNVVVTFAPQALQAYGGTIVVHADATGGSNTVACSGTGVQAVTHFVALAATNPVPPYLTWDTAATNIQAAVDVSIAGDTVLVSNGVYATGGHLVTGAGGTNRVAITSAIKVQSVNGPFVTAIRGAGPNGPAAVRCAFVTDGAELSGFTLTNGFTISNAGGGGFCATSTAAMVADCLIMGNMSSGNSTNADGGGASGGTLRRCSIVRNTASGSLNVGGGGVSRAVLHDCAILANSIGASVRGGSGVTASQLYNCTIVSNFVTVSPIRREAAVDCSLVNCIVYHNGATNYWTCSLTNCCTTPLPLTGSGNFTNDPLVAGMYNPHLLPGSPCIDAALALQVGSTTDFDGDARTNGAAVDVGCDEFWPSNSLQLTVLQPLGTNGTVASPLEFHGVTAGNPLGFTWAWGDGTVSNGSSSRATHAYETGGVYRIAATVTNDGSAATNFWIVRITPLTLVWNATDSTNWNFTATNWVVWGNTAEPAVFTNSCGVVFGDDRPDVQTNVWIGTNAIAPPRVTVNSESNRYTISGSIGGGGTLVKSGNSVLTLASNCAFTGGLLLSGGTLRLASGRADTLQPVLIPTIEAGATLDLGAQPQAFRGLNGAGTVTGSAGRLSIVIQTDSTSVFSGTLTGGFDLTKWGGPLHLRGSNSFTGNINLTNGPLIVYHSSALGVGPKMVHMVDGTAGRPNLTLDGSGGSIALASNIRFTTSWVGGSITNKAGTNTIFGNIDMTWGGGDTTIVSAGGHLTLAGVMEFIQAERTLQLGGSGDGIVSGTIHSYWCPSGGCWYHGVTKKGSGTWALTATNNRYPGPTLVTQGTLKAGKGALSFTGVTVNDRLVIEHNETDVLVNALSGTGTIVKAGAGTVTTHGRHLFSGRVQISNGVLVARGGFSNASVTITGGATFGGTGTVGNVDNAGTLMPGCPLGALRLQEYVQEQTGLLELDLGGTTPGLAHDLLEVADLALLDGGLTAHFTEHFVPAAGDSFTVLQAGSVAGTFATTNLPDLPEGGGWRVDYGSTTVVLVVTGSLPAVTGYPAFVRQIPDPFLRGYFGDPDGDGYLNLLEYATSGAPTNADDLARMNGQTAQGRFALTFHRNTSADDITLIVEGGNALDLDAVWTGIATNLLGSWGDATNVTETGTTSPVLVSVQDPEGSGTNRYLRLRVTRP